MPFVKGQIANPKGRPPLGRSMADSIRAELQRKVKVGNRYTTKQAVLSGMIVDAMVTSACVTLSGKVIQLNPKLWLELVKFVGVHTDGPMPSQLDITSAGQPLKAYIGYSPDDWDDVIDAEIIEPKQLPSGE